MCCQHKKLYTRCIRAKITPLYSSAESGTLRTRAAAAYHTVGSTHTAAGGGAGAGATGPGSGDPAGFGAADGLSLIHI